MRELCFIPADPPRAGCFVRWSLPGASASPGAGVTDPPAVATTVDVALRSGRTVRSTTVAGEAVAMSDALDWLAHLPATVDPAHPVSHEPDVASSTALSELAWSRVVRFALSLVARGRLLPGITAGGNDTWRVGPFDAADEALLAALVAAFPPAAHAATVEREARPDGTPGARPGPVLAQDPRWVVVAALDAVADTLVRTAAAPLAAPHTAYASSRVTDLTRWPDWLAAIDRGLDAGARPVIRLYLPYDDDYATELEAGVDERDLGITATLLLRSNADPSLLVEAAQLWTSPASVLDRFGEDAETDLLLALRRGASVWAPLARALDDAQPTVIELTPDEADDLLGRRTEALSAAGFEVLWPVELLQTQLSVRGHVATPTPESVAGAGIDLGSLLDFRWRAQLDGADLTDAELDALAAAKRSLVKVRGRWVAADPALLAKVRERRKVRATDLLAASMRGTLTVGAEEVPIEVDGVLADLGQRLRSFDPTRELQEPVGLAAELRPYQRRGLAWMAEMTELGLGGCLADDMGLGKTIQLIALHLHRHRDGVIDPRPTLVVCPTTLLGNWEREVHRFAPGVPVRRYHGGTRSLDDLAPNEIVLVTYGVVRRDRPALAEVPWDLVVADEAQHVKNPLARTARELRQIPARARLGLTGTPVENRLTELWALLDWTTPGLLGTLTDFRRGVAIPVERDRDEEATARFAALIRPFLLRRRKSDPEVAPDLPPKTETDVLVPLTVEQLSLYESFAQEMLLQIKKVSELSAEEKADRERERGTSNMERRGLIFKLLTGLKQITNHPAQFLKETEPVAGRSGKLAAFDELIDVIVDSGEHVLVFTQYVEMGKLIQEHLRSRGITNEFLNGRTSVRRRQEMVDAFQAGELPVFVLSLKAGGTGLNLTRATHVIHYDRWWNPAVEDQATDRAYRIGQDRPVQVYRLMSEGTVEDRIAELLAVKRGLADAVVGDGEVWLSELDDDALADLVGFGSQLTTDSGMRRFDD